MTKKFKSFLIILAFLSLSLSNVVAQSTDEVSLQKPAEGETVANTYNIEWRIVDTDIQDPAYFIDVFNLTCAQNGGNLGRITNSGAEIENSTYTYSWDTKSGNLANSLQNGGNYCMRVCGILADGGSVYSKCDKKSFVYSSESSSTNKPPTITDSKEGFNITINEIFNYQVEAEDPDGDSLSYSFLSAPDFLSIDKVSGKITGKPTEVGDIRFIVKVDDSKGGIASQEFVLNIQLTNTQKEVEFEFPKSGSIISPDNSTIKWKVKSGINTKTITLSYSKDKSEWIEITKQDRDLGQFDWNTRGMDDGNYYIRILLVDNTNKLYEIVSDQFTISSQSEVTETEITNLNPESGSKLTENRPLISAEFKTPEGVTINTESVKFTLNDRIDLTICEINENSITCEIVGELTNDTYTVYLEIMDSGGSTITKEWKFDVNSSISNNQEQEDSQEITGNTTQLILIIFAVGFLLIALPWSIYLLLKRRKAKKSESISPSESSTINPITPQSTEQAQPIIGSQGLELKQESPVIPNTPNLTINNQAEEAINPLSGTQILPGNEQNISTSNTMSNLPGYQNILNNEANTVPPMMTQVNNSADQTQNTPQTNPTITIPGSSNNTENGVIVNNNSNVVNEQVSQPEKQLNIDRPISTEQPAMYRTDEIPDWLAKDIPDTTLAQNQQSGVSSSMDEIISNTEIKEGAKVFDPYGLALKADETEDNTSNN